MIIGHKFWTWLLDINSVRNKFESLQEKIKDKIDIILVSETKFDDTFPVGKSWTDGYLTSYDLNFSIYLRRYSL